MDALLDIIWNKIMTAILFFANGLNAAVSPLNIIGPAAVIFILAILIVILTKFLSRTIVTKRYIQLKKEFLHWHDLRKQAMACEDIQKGRALAKNIDQAELNKAYYDFFFEGLLLNLVTKYLPIFSMAAYVNEFYRPERLLALFGRDSIFTFSPYGGNEFVIPAVLWYIISLFIVYLGWYALKKGYTRLNDDHKLKSAPA